MFEDQLPDPSPEEKPQESSKEQPEPLLDDPDIRALIDARKAGKRVRVVVDEEKSERESSEDDPLADLSPDDPVRKTVETVLSLVEKKFGTKISKLEELEKTLSDVKNVTTNVQREKVAAQIDDARRKFPDFDSYKNEMIQLSTENPNLGVVDLYVLAKARSGKLQLAPRGDSFSERPTAVGGNPKTQAKKDSLPAGRKGFNTLLQDALERVITE